MQPASSLQVSKSWSRRPHVTGALTLALTSPLNALCHTLTELGAVVADDDDATTETRTG